MYIETSNKLIESVNWLDWFLSNVILIMLLRLTIIVGVVLVVKYVAEVLYEKAIRKLKDKNTLESAYQITLLKLLSNVTHYVILFCGFIAILQVFGLDGSFVVAVAGIVGAVLAFGMQDLVKDIVSGIFIMLEGYLAIGDEVEIGSYKGKVLEVGIRTTRLAGENDEEYIITNQTIKNMTNYTKLARKKEEMKRNEAEKDNKVEVNHEDTKVSINQETNEIEEAIKEDNNLETTE